LYIFKTFTKTIRTLPVGSVRAEITMKDVWIYVNSHVQEEYKNQNIKKMASYR